MPGYLLHVGAPVICTHLGPATPAAPAMPPPKVAVSGQQVVTMASAYKVTGCTFPAMTSGAPPCTAAQWVSGSLKIQSMGSPVLLTDSQATTVPNVTPLKILGSQFLVKGM